MRSLTAVAVVLATFGCLAGCKRPQTGPATDSPLAVAAEPAVDAPVSEPVAASDGAETVITVRAVIAAMPTQYSASFAAQRELQHVAEQRSARGHQASGRYEFHGARVVRYSGEELQGRRTVELQFDLQGGVLSNTAGLPAADLAAIKTRGQLLRSHALAQLAAREHTTH